MLVYLGAPAPWCSSALVPRRFGAQGPWCSSAWVQLRHGALAPFECHPSPHQHSRCEVGVSFIFRPLQRHVFFLVLSCYFSPLCVGAAAAMFECHAFVSHPASAQPLRKVSVMPCDVNGHLEALLHRKSPEIEKEFQNSKIHDFSQSSAKLQKMFKMHFFTTAETVPQKFKTCANKFKTCPTSLRNFLKKREFYCFGTLSQFLVTFYGEGPLGGHFHHICTYGSREARARCPACVRKVRSSRPGPARPDRPPAIPH